LFQEKGFEIGQRLWVIAGAGGVGIKRTTLNDIFPDCNLVAKDSLTNEREIKEWEDEKAKWEMKAGFTFSIGAMYRQEGLNGVVKLQYDKDNVRRMKKE